MTELTIELIDSQGNVTISTISRDTASDFRITEETLDEDLCRQGQLMVEYGDIMADMKVMLARKEEHVKFVQAVVAQEIRAEWEQEGIKGTEGKLSEKVITDDRYQQALRELNYCRADALKADNYWRTIVKKTDLLNAVAYRQGQEIKKMYG